MLHINLKGITMQQLSSNYFAPPPPLLTLGTGSKAFSEQFHIAIQIKGKRKCSNMVANIFPAATPPPNPGGQKVKIQLFQNMVILHIKFKEITNAAQLDSKYFTGRPSAPPHPGGQKVKIQLIQNMVMLHNQIKGNGA